MSCFRGVSTMNLPIKWACSPLFADEKAIFSPEMSHLQGKEHIGFLNGQKLGLNMNKAC